MHNAERVYPKPITCFLFRMCRSQLVLFSLLLFGTPAFTQPGFTKRSAIGLHATFYDFKGADSIKQFGKTVKAGLALSYQNSLSRRFDVQATLGGTFIDFTDHTGNSLANGKEQLLIEATGGLRARLLPLHFKVFPFVYAGAGFSHFNSYYGVFIPAGLGMQANITPDIYLLVNAQYRARITSTQNNHFLFSIGLAGVIGKKKMTPQKPLPPMPVIVAVAKDADGDGIVDSADACVQVPGYAKYKGCPIPDTDKDGVNDEEDKCPDVPGSVFLKGCPIPDRDKDGIIDEQDQCPDLAGPGTRNGCPAITDSLKLRMATAARNIFFETGKYSLLPASYAALDEVVNVMKLYANLQLTIEGHTDNAGTPAGNKLLSDNRAKAVFDYLAQKGIATERLTATGFGQEKPVTTNKTTAGRAKNRRVELKLH
jgi:OmpA-OmpF porin, OOP family